MVLPTHRQVADNQTDKKDAFNARLADQDALRGNVLDIDVDYSNAYTVNNAEFYKNCVFRIADAAGADGDITITVPATPRPLFALVNDTAQSVYVKVSGQTQNRYISTLTTGYFFFDNNNQVQTPHGIDVTAGDPNFADVKLLLPFDGTDGDTTTTDESNVGHTVNFDTNAQISNAQSKFGGTSLKVGATNGEVYINDSADLELGSSNFTIEGWFYRATNGTTALFSKYNTTGNQRSYELLYTSSSQTLNFWRSTTGTSGAVLLGTTSYEITTGTWHYIAIDYDGTTYRMYAGESGTATMIDSSTTAGAFFDSTAVFAIGGRSNGSSLWGNGHVDDFRVTIGTARYASDSGFTIPTEAHSLM